MERRSACCVPHCRRTTKGQRSWLCGEHWRVVSPLKRRLLRRAIRRGDDATVRMVWGRCVAEAIEVAAAIRARKSDDREDSICSP